MVTLSLSLSVSFSSSLWLVLGFREFHQTCDEADASDYLAIIVITVEHSQHHSTSDPHGKCGWGKGMISRWLNYTFIALLCDFEGIIFIRRVSLSLSLSLSTISSLVREGLYQRTEFSSREYSWSSRWADPSLIVKLSQTALGVPRAYQSLAVFLV